VHQVRLRFPARSQLFELTTRIIHWDESRFYVEHLFVADGQVYVRTLLEGLVRSPSGVLKPNDVFSAAGFTGGSPSVSQEEMAQIDALIQSSRFKQ
jgi:hypothetical protein